MYGGHDAADFKQSVNRTERIHFMQITNELLAQKIYSFLTDTLPSRQKNAAYYRTSQTVNKGKIVSGRPNNILRSNICKYITDVHTGYFMGVPMTFDFTDDALDSGFNAAMPREVFHELLFSLSRDMSIYGTAFCLVYGAGGRLSAVKQSPERAFTIYDDTLGRETVAAVRFSKTERDAVYGEAYVKGGRYPFVYSDKEVTMGAFEELPYGGFSLIEFPNNEDKCGDFEPVLSLMDAYNVLLSGAVDDMQSVSNAFLALYGMQGTTKEDIDEANRSRVLSLSENGRAEFVVKNVNPDALDSLKKTLLENMLLVTMTPNLLDESFGRADSGVALEYKLWGIEQARTEKQRYFTRSLFELFEAIFAYLGIVPPKDFCSVRFYKNLPRDSSKICSDISAVGDILSRRTKLELLPFIENASAELEKIKQEQEENNETKQI